MAKRVCFPFVGDTIGGSHISALALIEALDRRQYRPVVVLHQRGPLAQLLDHRSIEYETLPLDSLAGSSPRLFQILGSALRAAPRLRRFLRANRIGIVHCNDLRTNLTWFLGARLGRARFLWHQRTRPFSRSPIWRLVPWLADHVAFISEATRDAMPTMRRGKATVITNPFDVEADPPCRRLARCELIKELEISSEAAVIGFVGRFVKQKRPDLFIEVAGEIAQRSDVDCAFVMLAPHDSEAEARLVMHAEALGIGSMIHFVGFRIPIAPWLAAFDLLIAPAYGDGFGRAIVESILVQTPVIASASGGHPEIIETDETGVLIEGEDPQAYAVAAGRLLKDQAFRDRMTTAAKQMARSRYSTTVHTRQIMQLYDKLTGRVV